MRTRALLLPLLLVLPWVSCVADDVEDEDFVGGGSSSPSFPRRPSDGDDAAVDNDDAATSNDGGSPDDSTVNCQVVFDPFDAAFSASTAQSFSVAASLNELTLAYVVPACGGVVGSTTSFGLRTVTLSSTGEISALADPTALGESGCFVTRDPALTDNELFYVANTRGYQLTRVVTRQTTALAREVSDAIGLFPQALEAVSVGSVSLAFWATTETVDQSSDILVFRENQPLPVTRLLTREEGQRVASMAASRLLGPAGALGRALVAWVSDSDGAPGMFARVIDEDAVALSLFTLSSRAGPASTIDVTASEEGGAVVYAVASTAERYELRFRTIDRQGAFGPEVKITGGNESAVDPSIAPHGQGYVIAARVLSVQGPVIRLTFVDEGGGLLAARGLLPTTGTPGRVRVRAAQDGRLFLVWTERDESSSTLHARRVECAASL